MSVCALYILACGIYSSSIVCIMMYYYNKSDIISADNVERLLTVASSPPTTSTALMLPTPLSYLLDCLTEGRHPDHIYTLPPAWGFTLVVVVSGLCKMSAFSCLSVCPWHDRATRATAHNTHTHTRAALSSAQGVRTKKKGRSALWDNKKRPGLSV